MFRKTIVVQHWRSAPSTKRLKCSSQVNSSFLAMLIAQMIQRSIINLSSEMCIRKCRAESGWVIVWYSGGVDARLSPHMVLHPWLCIIEEKTWTKSTKSASFVWWDMLPLFLNFFKSSFFQAACHQHLNTDGMWGPRLKSVVIGDLSTTNRNVSQPLGPTTPTPTTTSGFTLDILTLLGNCC